MIQIVIDNNDYADNNGKYPVTTYVSDSLRDARSDRLRDAWGESGALEAAESEITNIREFLGRLVATLAENEILSPEQVYYLARGFDFDGEHPTFERGY